MVLLHSVHLRPRLIGVISALLCSLSFSTAHAAVFGGGGLVEGIEAASGLGGILAATTITELLIHLVEFVLNFVALLAVIAIIVAGIYLIVSGGDEGQKDKAKKIVFYAIGGLVLILFARVIVLFINNIF